MLSGTAPARVGPYADVMRLDYTKATVATLWALVTSTVGLAAGVTSVRGLVLLASLGLLPPLAMLLLWQDPPQSIAATIHEARR